MFVAFKINQTKCLMGKLDFVAGNGRLLCLHPTRKGMMHKGQRGKILLDSATWSVKSLVES